LYSCCGVQKKEEGEERVGVGSRGKYPGALPHHIGKKRKKKKADRKVPDRPLVVKGERLLKKKKKNPYLLDYSYPNMHFFLLLTISYHQ
jgi:hypothetical protein